MAESRAAEAEALKEQGNIAYRNEDYRTALICYTKAIALCATPSLYSNRAASFMAIKNFKEAINDCQKSVELDPTWTKGFARQARCYLSLGDTSSAREIYAKAIAVDPTSPTLKTEMRQCEQLDKAWPMAQELISQGQTEKALALLDTILSFAASFRPAQIAKANLLLQLKRYDDIAPICRDLLTDEPTNPEAIYLRAMTLLYSQNNVANAKELLRESLRVDPDNTKVARAFKRLNQMENKKTEANEAFKSSRFAEAVSLYAEVLAIDPEASLFNSQILNNKATALSKIGKYREALQDVNKSIELDETYVKAYMRRADVLQKLEQFDDAVRDWEKLCEMDSDNSEFRRGLKDAKLALKKSKRKDYYKILEVAQDAAEDDIRRAYKRAALKYHPDKNSETEESRLHAEKMFKDVGEAYGVLSDQQKRERYDQGADIEEIEGGGGGGGFSANDLFAQMFAQQGGFGGMGGGFGGFGGGFGGMGGHGHHGHGHHGHSHRY